MHSFSHWSVFADQIHHNVTHFPWTKSFIPKLANISSDWMQEILTIWILWIIMALFWGMTVFQNMYCLVRIMVNSTHPISPIINLASVVRTENCFKCFNRYDIHCIAWIVIRHNLWACLFLSMINLASVVRTKNCFKCFNRYDIHCIALIVRRHKLWACLFLSVIKFWHQLWSTENQNSNLKPHMLLVSPLWCLA